MESNKYALAGWLAITQAILFPLIFILGIFEERVTEGLFVIEKQFIGPSDLLMVLFTVIVIYTLLKLKRFLNEQYECRELDQLIIVAIWWFIVFQAVSFALMIIALAKWPIDDVMFVIVYFIFLASAMVTIGIVNILIAVKLLKLKEHLGDYFRGFAYITMAAGICEVSVLFSPLSILLVPITGVVMALIFFKDKHEVEYV